MKKNLSMMCCNSQASVVACVPILEWMSLSDCLNWDLALLCVNSSFARLKFRRSVSTG